MWDDYFHTIYADTLDIVIAPHYDNTVEVKIFNRHNVFSKYRYI